MPTKVEILMNGAPLEGAIVYVGEIGGNEKETDEDGKVSLPNVPEGFAGYTEVLIASPVYASAKVIIKYNETTTIELGYDT